MPIFVPLVTVDLQPAKNGEHPSIEMTTRSGEYPPYEIPLLRHKWGNHAASITERPLAEGRNPLWELVSRQGVPPLDGEETRLVNKYGRRVFFEVYPVGKLAAVIMEAAKPANEWLEARQREAEEIAMEAAGKAADSIVQRAAKSVATAENRRGPGRPRRESTPA